MSLYAPQTAKTIDMDFKSSGLSMKALTRKTNGKSESLEGKRRKLLDKVGLGSFVSAEIAGSSWGNWQSTGWTKTAVVPVQQAEEVPSL